jgi:hypothetical protein
MHILSLAYFDLDCVGFVSRFFPVFPQEVMFNRELLEFFAIFLLHECLCFEHYFVSFITFFANHEFRDVFLGLIEHL